MRPVTRRILPLLSATRRTRGAGTVHGRVLFAALSIIVILAALHVVNRVTLDVDELRLDGEENVPTWASTLAFALAGAGWLWLAAAQRPARRSWTLLGLVMLTLSYDEMARVHERVSAHTGAGPAELVLQPAIGLSLVALIVAAARTAHPFAQPLLALAVAALVLGHLSELATPAPEEGTVAAALKILEESFELLLGGAILAAAAAHRDGDHPRGRGAQRR